jgi:hypothetical protein
MFIFNSLFLVILLNLIYGVFYFFIYSYPRYILILSPVSNINADVIQFISRDWDENYIPLDEII